MVDTEKKHDRENYDEFKRTGICPVCKYAGRNTRDPIEGTPMKIPHGAFAREHKKIECAVAVYEEKMKRGAIEEIMATETEQESNVAPLASAEDEARERARYYEMDMEPELESKEKPEIVQESQIEALDEARNQVPAVESSQDIMDPQNEHSAISKAARKHIEETYESVINDFSHGSRSEAFAVLNSSKARTAKSDTEQAWMSSYFKSIEDDIRRAGVTDLPKDDDIWLVVFDKIIAILQEEFFMEDVDLDGLTEKEKENLPFILQVAIQDRWALKQSIRKKHIHDMFGSI